VSKYLFLTLSLFLVLLVACGGGSTNQDAKLTPSPGTQQPQTQSSDTSLPADNTANSVQDLKASVQANPSLDGYFELGNALSRQGQFSDARSAFEEALKINPNHIGSLSNLGVVYYQTSEFDKAIANFEKVLSLDSQDAATHYLYGATLLQMSNYSEAEQRFEDALKIQPDLPEAHFGLGTLYWQMGRVSEAITEFETFLSGPPAQDPQARAQAEQILKQLRAQK